MSRDDLIWAAGFFDGEGCVLIRKNGRTYVVRITVSQVNPTPVRLLKDLFRGHISYQQPKNKNWSAQWKWEQDSKSAVETLKLLLPFLKVKADVAELAIEFQKGKKRGNKPTDADVERELTFKERISVLNRKD